MPGTRITDQQVRLYMNNRKNKFQALAAAKAGSRERRDKALPAPQLTPAAARSQNRRPPAGVRDVATGRQWMIIGAASLCIAHGPVRAADVGGWYADQQKAALAGSQAGTASCPQAVARAAAEPTAIGAYQAAHCYLQGDAPDLVAAKAWLSRSAELNFMPAHRLLRSLQLAEAGVHAGQRHCHDLGEGRQLCHGAAPTAAATN